MVLKCIGGLRVPEEPEPCSHRSANGWVARGGLSYCAGQQLSGLELVNEFKIVNPEPTKQHSQRTQLCVPCTEGILCVPSFKGRSASVEGVIGHVSEPLDHI